MIKIANEKQSANALMNAMKSGNEKEIKQAWENFHDSIVESVKAEFEDLMKLHLSLKRFPTLLYTHLSQDHSPQCCTDKPPSPRRS